MGNLVSNRQLFGLESEVTQNTAAVLEALDYAYAIDPQIDQEVEKLPQEFSRSTLDPLPETSGKKHAKIEVGLPLRWSLASNTENKPLLAALKAIGFAATGGTGATDWTLTPTDTPPSNMLSRANSATATVIKDGLLHSAPGCVGNGKFVFKTGQMGILQLSLQGIDAAVTDQASWPTSPEATPLATAIPTFESAAVKVDNATGHVISELEIDLGNTVQMVDDAAAASGVGGFMLTDKKPVITFTVLAKLVATYDYWNKYRAGTAINSSSVGLQFVLGTAAMNKFTFTIPSIQLRKVAYADIGGIRAFKVTANPTFSTAADWMNLVIDNA